MVGSFNMREYYYNVDRVPQQDWRLRELLSGGEGNGSIHSPCSNVPLEELVRRTIATVGLGDILLNDGNPPLRNRRLYRRTSFDDDNGGAANRMLRGDDDKDWVIEHGK